MLQQHDNMQNIVKKFCLKCLECIRRGTKNQFFPNSNFLRAKNFQMKHVKPFLATNLSKRVFASHDFWMVLKPSRKWEKIWKNLDSFDTSRKWEMIWKNPNSFETVQKMGNDLEKSGQFIRFFCYTRKKFLDQPKKNRVACYPATKVFAPLCIRRL